MTPLLDIRDLSLAFKTRSGLIPVIQNLSLTLAKGQVLGLVGESGCGKSLTAQAILRLGSPLQQASGAILWNGENLLDKTEIEMGHIRGRQIGMIFQDPNTSLNPTLTVGYQMIEGLCHHFGITKQEAYAKAAEWLASLQLTAPQERLHQYPHELSGGMKQRILIALALMCEPKLLIADEPTTALDVTSQAQILEILKLKQKEMALSVLLISHDLGVVATLCDTLAIMYAGQIIEQGPTREVLRNPRHPYTQGLVAARRSLEQKKETCFYMPGLPPQLKKQQEGCRFKTRCPYAMKICAQAKAPIKSISKEHSLACWLEYKP